MKHRLHEALEGLMKHEKAVKDLIRPYKDLYGLIQSNPIQIATGMASIQRPDIDGGETAVSGACWHPQLNNHLPTVPLNFKVWASADEQ